MLVDFRGTITVMGLISFLYLGRKSEETACMDARIGGWRSNHLEFLVINVMDHPIGIRVIDKLYPKLDHIQILLVGARRLSLCGW